MYVVEEVAANSATAMAMQQRVKEKKKKKTKNLAKFQFRIEETVWE